jgi:hypothetical protein
MKIKENKTNKTKQNKNNRFLELMTKSKIVRIGEKVPDW